MTKLHTHPPSLPPSLHPPSLPQVPNASNWQDFLPEDSLYMWDPDAVCFGTEELVNQLTHQPFPPSLPPSLPQSPAGA